MARIRVGVIGFGFSAQTFHLPLILALSDLFKLVSLHIRTPPNPLPAFLADCLVYSSLDEFLASPIDLVVITASPDSRLPLSLASLDANKHILLEKPIAPSSEEAAAILKHAEAKGLLVSVYHNRRFDGDFLSLRKLFGLNSPAKHLSHPISSESSTLGKILDFESQFERFRPSFRSETSISWKESGAVRGSGLLLDIGSHLVDQVLCLFGIPNSVQAVVLEDQRQMVEAVKRFGPAGDGYIPANDYFHIVLRYGNELVVKISGSNMLRNVDTRFIVHGTKGSFIKTGLDSQENALKAVPIGTPAPIDLPSFGTDPKERFGRLILDQDGGKETRMETSRGAYIEFYRQLAVAIAEVDNSKLPCSGYEGWVVMKILEAALESEKTGRRVIIKEEDLRL
ncbi:hypothetical protein HK096_001689 [Nowakowskiella sp. JEL0078]|nr:hypothetical protein HK096_001689 [Nowakowskiella sp. JEL0078]